MWVIRILNQSIKICKCVGGGGTESESGKTRAKDQAKSGISNKRKNKRKKGQSDEMNFQKVREFDWIDLFKPFLRHAPRTKERG